DRQMDVAVGVGWAGLEQGDGNVRILAQPGGQDAAGRAAADDDVVRHSHSLGSAKSVPCSPPRNDLKSLVPRQEKGYGYRVEGLSYKWRSLATRRSEVPAALSAQATGRKQNSIGRFDDEGQDRFYAYRQGQPPDADDGCHRRRGGARHADCI